MLKSLERAVAEAERLPPDMQDDLARLMMLYLGEEQPVVDLTPDQEAKVLRSREAASRGEFATAEQMRAIWSKYDR